MSRWSTATMREEDFRASYSPAIAALEVAKGSLLEYWGITLDESPPAATPEAEPPYPGRASPQRASYPRACRR